MTNFTVWEIGKIQEFLKDKEQIMLNKVSDSFSKKIISIVFEYLSQELNYEEAEKEFSNAHGQ